jgi:hypothetical protein
VPLVYTMSRTRIAPSASKLILRLGAVVLIGVRRRSVGRDNGTRRRVPAHSEAADAINKVAEAITGRPDLMPTKRVVGSGE